MKNYIVTITEILQKEIYISALTQEMAILKVKQDYNDEIHVLDDSNYIDTDFEAAKQGD